MKSQLIIKDNIINIIYKCKFMFYSGYLNYSHGKKCLPYLKIFKLPFRIFLSVVKLSTILIPLKMYFNLFPLTERNFTT